MKPKTIHYSWIGGYPPCHVNPDEDNLITTTNLTEVTCKSCRKTKVFKTQWERANIIKPEPTLIFLVGTESDCGLGGCFEPVYAFTDRILAEKFIEKKWRSDSWLIEEIELNPNWEKEL